MPSENKEISWLDRELIDFRSLFRVETVLIALVIVLAVISRFAILGERVMSHDEVNHVVPSYDLFQGKGYRHDPVTHGPFQFHIVALSYFLFGDSDFSSRIPAALFSIGGIVFTIFAFRRYLGRAGALITGFLFVISPYMLFYGRYTRNEAFIMLLGVVTIYSFFRYMEKRDNFSTYLMTGSLVMHFCVKETAFIYTAQLLLFILFTFLDEVRQARFRSPKNLQYFSLFMLAGLVVLGATLGYAIIQAPHTVAGATTQTPAITPPSPVVIAIELVGVLIGLGLLTAGIFILVKDLGWKQLRQMPAFNLLFLVGTLILPQLSALPVRLIGWNPIDYSPTGIPRTAIIVVLVSVASVVIGIWWNARLWIKNAILFYSVFTILYTTFFTNGQGFFTGLVGSLGYWLSQQGVQRGSQPLYYYALIQIPIYEYLAALGTILAGYFGIRYRLFSNIPGFPLSVQPDIPKSTQPNEPPSTDEQNTLNPSGSEFSEDIVEEDLEDYTILPPAPPLTRLPVLAMLLFWSISSLFAYSVAGEKMPWLTVHIALPLILTAGWGLGFLVETTPWKNVVNGKGIISILSIIVFITSSSAVIGRLLGNQAPFQGNTTEELTATSLFLLSLIMMVGSAYLVQRLLNDWEPRHILRLFTVTFFGLLIVLTARAAYMASFINYDYATEYLVYAHAAPGPKEILKQVEEISQRTTRGKDIMVAHDNDSLYPFWWYFRDYPNHKWFTDKFGRELRDYVIILAGEENYARLEPIVSKNYIRYEYNRLWWPNQDYFGLTWNRISYALSNPDMRTAIFQIWLNRDYTLYSKITQNPSIKPETWQPAARMRMYIRRDVVGQIWNYGLVPSSSGEITSADPYEAGMIKLSPDLVFGSTGVEPGKLQKPRSIAVAPDGSVYVADSLNHRIQHFSANGELLHVWGAFIEMNAANKPGGRMNEPWGIAVGLDGSVFITDTWNNRIQKFTPDGKFIKTWGFPGQAEKPEAFWGPRGLAVDSQGWIYVTDTGNKRVVVFDAEGGYITEFGSLGVDRGQFDEPVGIAVDDQGYVYVADTWNQRIQVFAPTQARTGFVYAYEWDINGWFGQSLDNKPFLAVNKDREVYVADPEGFRVLVFTYQGKFIRGWGDPAPGFSGFGLVSGIAVDQEGRIWVSDGGNNRLLRFTMPK